MVCANKVLQRKLLPFLHLHTYPLSTDRIRCPFLGQSEQGGDTEPDKNYEDFCAEQSNAAETFPRHPIRNQQPLRHYFSLVLQAPFLRPSRQPHPHNVPCVVR